MKSILFYSLSLSEIFIVTQSNEFLRIPRHQKVCSLNIIQNMKERDSINFLQFSTLQPTLKTSIFLGYHNHILIVPGLVELKCVPLQSMNKVFGFWEHCVYNGVCEEGEDIAYSARGCWGGGAAMTLRLILSFIEASLMAFVTQEDKRHFQGYQPVTQRRS